MLYSRGTRRDSDQGRRPDRIPQGNAKAVHSGEPGPVVGGLPALFIGLLVVIWPACDAEAGISES